MKLLIENLKIISLIIFCGQHLMAQENKFTRKNKNGKIIQYSTNKCYSRSIIIQDSIVFTANSNGSLYRTNLNNLKSTNIMENKKFEEMRDIELVNGILLGMQSGSYGLLAKTDGTQFIDYITPKSNMWIGTFLDGMDFHGLVGFMMGDPKKKYFSLYHSEDGGLNWKECEGKVEAFEGEAGFAGSGTNVQVLNDSTFVFVSGGKKSRFFKSSDKGKTWQITSIPYMNSESSGAFSIQMMNDSIGVITGGDYLNPDLNLNTTFYTNDGGEFWQNAMEQPGGYRSNVICHKGIYYVCGTNGIDFSTDFGLTWRPFANGNFYSMCANEHYLFATIPNGSFQVFNLIK